MRSMTLQLLHASGSESFDDVTSFVAEDASGSFGILPGHAPMMTALSVGLARFRTGNDVWHYLALPGGILSGGKGTLTLCTRRYLHDTDFRQMGALLTKLHQSEEETLGGIRESLHRLEEEMMRRLREIERGSEP
jgi:F-type H+-transporting ATPase subunit epsilon